MKFVIVLKHGDHYKEIDCPTCKARIGYTTTDLRVKEDYGDYFGNDYYWSYTYIDCPECNRQIKIKEIDSKG